MNAISDRISQCISLSGLTKTAFAQKIGLTQAYVSALSIGRKTPSDRTITDICREFNVNEQWLRTGEGEMFVGKPESVLDELAKEYNLDELDRKMMTGYLKLNAGERVAIKQYMQNIIGNMKDDSPPAAPQVDPQSEIAELRRQVQEVLQQNQELKAKIEAIEQEDELQNPWSDSDAG